MSRPKSGSSNSLISLCARAGLAAFCSLGGLAPVTGAAQVAPETLPIYSVTATDTQFLQGQARYGSPAHISGKLQLPGGEGPYPAVIILHGSSGAGSMGYRDWETRLNAAGFATLLVDSYTARGVEEIFSDQGRLGEFYAVYDAYRAADALARHAAIDPGRIAVLGFSRGGIGALYSAMDRFAFLYGPAEPLAAHVPFYPPCNFALEDPLQTTGAPIRLFHGEADDWNPLAACERYIAALAAAGTNAEITTYPDASHAFDNSAAPAFFVVGEAQTSRACFRTEYAGVLYADDNFERPFGWDDGCVETGPSQQFQREAAMAAKDAVIAFLVETLTPK
ncbi:dienelactone hydrolase family protein [Pelagibacterium luteolum]|uniref:Dienelactone hydrolase n=1 Tax=Pelagibacterium luteolum TaxID=440168 RepID=A0A1G7STB2_9HYPH|nr:dienelactone hydrolase family protein [Pelagibacterium luteolum]SDG26024.1 Dienelactone hydrolase [Pelagibacterium luteolum]